MNTFDPHATIDEFLCVTPTIARVLENLGIDSHRDGNRPMGEVCRAQGLEPRTVVRMLTAFEKAAPRLPAVTVELMTLTELSDHIVETHHASLLCELAHLDSLTRIVAARHGAGNPRLLTIRKRFTAFREMLLVHLHEEMEEIFPLIRRLETSPSRNRIAYSALKAQTALMHSQHHEADEALAELHELAADCFPASSAPASVRTLSDAIIRLENSMHVQIYKEDRLLFPQALSSTR